MKSKATLICLLALCAAAFLPTLSTATEVGPPPEMVGFCGKVFNDMPFCNEPDGYLISECMDAAGGGFLWEQPCFTCIASLLAAGVIKHCDDQLGWCKFPFDVEP